MTTNGVLFARLAKPLAEAGLKRVNFSLDTLDPEASFNRLTRWGSWKMSGKAFRRPKLPG